MLCRLFCSSAVVTCLYASLCSPGGGGMKWEVYDLVAESGTRDRHLFRPPSNTIPPTHFLLSSSRDTRKDEGYIATQTPQTKEMRSY